MRIITLPLLAVAVGAQAQDFPFPTSDATWVQTYEVMISPPPIPTWQLWSTANFCMDGSDTLISGTNYSRLDYCNAGYVGGIRSVNQAVYFFPADSTQEYMLYDFGAAVGDTIFDVYVDELLATGSEGWMGKRLLDVVVLSKAPNSSYGGRIVMQVQAIDPDIGLDSEWIEGIGSVHGLFTLNPLNISKYWYGMECFSHLDTAYWNGSYTELPGTCASLSVGFTESERSTMRVYPNPTSGLVRVEGSEAGAVLQVIDAMGRVVHVQQNNVSQTGIEIDLSHLPAGVYQVSARDGAGPTRIIRW